MSYIHWQFFPLFPTFHVEPFPVWWQVVTAHLRSWLMKLNYLEAQEYSAVLTVVFFFKLSHVYLRLLWFLWLFQLWVLLHFKCILWFVALLVLYKCHLIFNTYEYSHFCNIIQVLCTNTKTQASKQAQIHSRHAIAAVLEQLVRPGGRQMPRLWFGL